MSREGSEVVLYEIVRGVIHWHRIFPLYCRSVRWPPTLSLGRGTFKGLREAWIWYRFQIFYRILMSYALVRQEFLKVSDCTIMSL